MLHQAWQTIHRWLLQGVAYFRPPLPPPTPVVEEAPPPLTPAYPAVGSPEAEERQQMTIVHVSDVLDSIPKARELLRKLKKFDRDAYSFHKRHGARILPSTGDDRLILGNALRDTALAALPGAGLVYIFHEVTDDEICGYLYFVKVIKRPWNVAPTADARCYYDVTHVFDVDGRLYGYSFYVTVRTDGRVRTVANKRIAVQHLPRQRNGEHGGSLHHSRWGIPAALSSTLQDRHEHGIALDVTDPYQWGASLFITAMNSFDASMVGFQILARRANRPAVSWSVPESRAKTFFRDREIEVTTDGRRRRIFHCVAEHDRTLPSGRVTKVAAHYRGARHFIWKDESIRIDPPEASMRHMDLGVEMWPDDGPTPSTHMAMGEFGGRLEATLDERSQVRGGYRASTTVAAAARRARRHTINQVNT
jgi:hypothetical protein